MTRKAVLEIVEWSFWWMGSLSENFVFEAFDLSRWLLMVYYFTVHDEIEYDLKTCILDK